MEGRRGPEGIRRDPGGEGGTAGLGIEGGFFMQDISVSTVAVVIQVLLYASVAYIALKRFKFPYTIGLVLIGLIIGAVVNIFGILPAFSRLHLTGNLILYALLPALIFDAALNMDVQLLKKNIVPVMVLAVPGLVVATLVSAWLVAAWTPLGMGAALVFGALISTTDPVAVIALFHELGAPKRLTMLVDGESLFNDATAIVMFAIMLGLVSSGAPFSVGTVLLAAVEFILVFIGGLMVGVAVGWVVMGSMRFVRADPLVQLTLTIVSAYLSFLLAQGALGLSGVMASVGAGLVTAHYGRVYFSRETRDYLHHFWSFSSFAANSFVFLVIGLTEVYLSRGHGFGATLFYALAAIVAITLARILIVGASFGILNLTRNFHRVNWREQVVLVLGGLRGALPIALAVSILPVEVGGEENRRLIVDFTLAVVLFSLLVQGTTMGLVLHRLGLMKEDLVGRMVRLRSAIGAWRRTARALSSTVEGEETSVPLFDEVRRQYEAGVQRIRGELQNIGEESPEEARRVASALTWRYVLAWMRSSVEFMHSAGVLDDPSALAIYLQIEEAADRNDHGETPTLAFRELEASGIQRAFLALLRRHAPDSEFFRNSQEERTLFMSLLRRGAPRSLVYGELRREAERSPLRHALGCMAVAVRARLRVAEVQEMVEMDPEVGEPLMAALQGFAEEARAFAQRYQETHPDHADEVVWNAMERYAAALARGAVGELKGWGMIDAAGAALLESMPSPFSVEEARAGAERG